MAGIIAGIVIALSTAIISAYVTRRGKTGKIDTSEAKDLWDTVRSELARLQLEATSLRAEIIVAREEMLALRTKTVDLQGVVSITEQKLVVCLEHCKELELELTNLKKKRATSVRKKPVEVVTT